MRTALRASWPGSWQRIAANEPSVERRARMFGELVGDDADLARQPALAQGREHAAIAGAEAVNADDVAIAVELGAERGLGDGGVVEALDRRQGDELRIFGAQHLLEAEAAFGVVAQQHRAGDDGDAPADAAQEPPHQRPAVRPAALLSMPT